MTDLVGGLEAFLCERLGTAVEVTELHRVGGGSSKEHWAFEAAWDGDARPLLLRRDPPAGVVETAAGDEAALLGRLADTPVPAPRLYAVDTEGAWFDRPALVVERLPGRAHRSVLRDKDPLGLRTGRRRLAEELVDLLAVVHAVPVTQVAGVLPLSPAEAELARAEHELQQVALEPLPEATLALRWLHEQLPAPGELHLVHGDFRPANVLVQDGRIMALLDWELAHLGDPVDDLGWHTCSLYRHEHFFEGWSVEDLLARYADRTGRTIDLGHLRFWQVLSVLRLTVIALRGVRAFVEGATDRPAAPPVQLLRQLLRDVG